MQLLWWVLGFCAVLQVEAEKREIETEDHLKLMADKETVRSDMLHGIIAVFQKLSNRPIIQAQPPPPQQQQQVLHGAFGKLAGLQQLVHYMLQLSAVTLHNTALYHLCSLLGPCTS